MKQGEGSGRESRRGGRECHKGVRESRKGGKECHKGVRESRKGRRESRKGRRESRKGGRESRKGGRESEQENPTKQTLQTLRSFTFGLLIDCMLNIFGNE